MADEVYYEDTPVQVEVGGVPQALTAGYMAAEIVEQLGAERLVAVRTVNGQDGEVVLDAADVRALADDAAAGGDLAGVYPAPSIADGAVAPRHVAAALLPSGAATDSTEALRRLGSGAGEASPGATSLGVVAHGATAGTARPAGHAQVLWVGSVEPTNMAVGDVWAREAA